MNANALFVSNPWDGASNLFALGNTLQAAALIRMSRSAGTNATAFLAQTDDFDAPTEGWGMGFDNSGNIRVFAVDDGGLREVTIPIEVGMPGALLVVMMRWTVGGNLFLDINGFFVGSTASGGANSVNSATVPFCGALNSTGTNTLGNSAQIVSLAVNLSGTMQQNDVWDSAQNQLFFDPEQIEADFIYNARTSILRDPAAFAAGDSSTLVNEGSTANDAGFGDLLDGRVVSDSKVGPLTIPARF